MVLCLFVFVCARCSVCVVRAFLCDAACFGLRVRLFVRLFVVAVTVLG